MGISNNASGLRPGVCTSTTRPTAPYTGQIIFETDTGYLRVWDGAAWDYLSQSQDDTTNIKAADLGAWTTYTPTWTNLTVGNATQTFRYSKLNGLGFVQGELTFGSTTSISGLVRMSLPSGWTISDNPVASLTYFLDNGVADFFGWSTRWDNSNLLIYVGNAASTYLQGSGLSSTVPFTWGSTDLMRIGATVRLS